MDFCRALEWHDADTVVVANNNVTGTDRAASAGNQPVDDATEAFVRSGRNDGAAEARKTQLTNFSDVPNGTVYDQPADAAFYSSACHYPTPNGGVFEPAGVDDQNFARLQET